jgi:hypothetical protein
MVAIKGKVIKHFLCINHAERNNLTEPTLAVVRLRPSSLTFDGVNSHHCSYELSTEYIKEIPIIDFCYQLETGSLLEELVLEDLVEMEVRNRSFHYLPHKLIGIKETPEGQVKFWNLNVKDSVQWDLGKKSRIVSKIDKIPNLANSYRKSWVKPTKEFINKLVKLPVAPNYQLPLDLDLDITATQLELVNV